MGYPIINENSSQLYPQILNDLPSSLVGYVKFPSRYNVANPYNESIALMKEDRGTLSKYDEEIARGIINEAAELMADTIWMSKSVIFTRIKYQNKTAEAVRDEILPLCRRKYEEYLEEEILYFTHDYASKVDDKEKTKQAILNQLEHLWDMFVKRFENALDDADKSVNINKKPDQVEKPKEENTFNIDDKTTATMDEAKSDPTQNFMTGQVVSMKDLDVETANAILESIENDPALVAAKKNNLLEGGFSLDSVKTLSSVTTSGEKMSFEETMSIIEKEKAILDDLEKTYYAYGGYDQRYAYRGYFIGSYMDEANATRSTASMTMEATSNTIAAVGATAGLATSALNAIPLIPVIAEQAISYIFECTLGYAMTFTQSIAEIVLDVPSYLVDRTAYWTTEYIKDQSELLSELTGDFDQLVDLEKQKADLALSAAIEKIAGDKIKVQSYNWNNKVKNWTETVTNIQEIIDRGPDAVQEILREQMGNLLHDIYDEAGKAHEEVRSEIYGNVDIGAEATGKWTAHKINVSAEFILKNTLDAVREEKENAALEVANMQYKAITQMRARLAVPLPPESDEPSVTTPDS